MHQDVREKAICIVDMVNEIKAELDSQIQHEFIERSCSKHEDYIVIIYRKKKKKKKKLSEKSTINGVLI